MKTILVTGFGPFNGHNINASWEAVKLLPDEVDDFVLVKTEIPVIYDKVERKIPTLWKELNPQVNLLYLLNHTIIIISVTTNTLFETRLDASHIHRKIIITYANFLLINKNNLLLYIKHARNLQY